MSSSSTSRREFIKLATTVLGGAIVGGLIGGYTGAYSAPKPPLEVGFNPPYRPVKIPTPPPTPPGARTLVAISKFNENTPEAFEAAVKNLINTLGRDKFNKLVSGRTVLLKVNWVDPFLVSWSEDPPNAKVGRLAAHTPPYLIVAVAKAVRDAGARRVIIGESSAFSTFSSAYEVLYLRGKEYMELPKEVEELKFVELADFNNQKQYLVDVPNPYAMYKVVMPTAIREADVIISLSRLKTHRMARITAGLKNLSVGGIPSSATSPAAANAGDWKKWQEFEKKFNDASYKDKKTIGSDFVKTRLHGASSYYFPKLAGSALPTISKNGFINAVMPPEYAMYQGAEIADCLEVFGGIQLSIIAAEYGLEGEAPVFQQKSFPVDMKERLGSYMLIGSFDPVACDVVGARIIGWGPQEIMSWPGIPGLHFCSMKGLGVMDPAQIEVRGLKETPIPASSVDMPSAMFLRSPWDTVWWSDWWLPDLKKYGEPRILSGLEA
ncbi:MAG: DUF362 domain-containing protein [Candidatus Methanomethylicia archaeon]